MRPRIRCNEVVARDGFQHAPAFEARALPARVGRGVPGRAAKAGRITERHPAPEGIDA